MLAQDTDKDKQYQGKFFRWYQPQFYFRTQREAYYKVKPAIDVREKIKRLRGDTQ